MIVQEDRRLAQHGQTTQARQQPVARQLRPESDDRRHAADEVAVLVVDVHPALQMPAVQSAIRESVRALQGVDKSDLRLGYGAKLHVVTHFGAANRALAVEVHLCASRRAVQRAARVRDAAAERSRGNVEVRGVDATDFGG